MATQTTQISTYTNSDPLAGLFPTQTTGSGAGYPTSSSQSISQVQIITSYAIYPTFFPQSTIYTSTNWYGVSPQSFLPWSWTVSYSGPDTSPACPPPSHIMGTFAAANVIATLLSIIFGNALVVRKLSCGRLGQQKESSWPYMWIVPLVLQLSANALIAGLMRIQSGYQHSFSIGELMIFYTTRPRFSWIPLVWLAQFGSRPLPAELSEDRRKAKDDLDTHLQQHKALEVELCGSEGFIFPDHRMQDPRYQQSLRTLWHLQQAKEHSDFEVSHSWWLSNGVTQFMAEIMLQSMAVYYMIKLAHYGVEGKNQGIDVNNLDLYLAPELVAAVDAANLMLGAAITYLALWFMFGLPILVVILIIILGPALRKAGSNLGFKQIWLKRYLIKLVATYTIVAMPSIWLPSWLFWLGYVRLSGDL